MVLTSSAATGNVWSNAATTQSINVISSGTYTVTQTVGGCTSPPSAAVVVTINPVPAAPNISASGPLSFCQGDSVILTSSVTSGNLWSDNESTQSIIVRSAGSYTVRDTSGGCPGAPSAAIVVTIVPGPTPSVRASRLSICPDSIVSLDATTASATAYLWSTGSTSPIITVNSPATYTVTVTVNGCNGTDAITIGTDPLLGPLSLPSVFNICIGDSVTLDATTLHASAYIWSPIGAVTPALTVAAQGIYTVTVSNNCGSSTATSSVSFKDCECRIYMPDAFTPNGDGVNDEIGLHYDCPNASYLSLRIFNRWGEKIYETNDLLGQWDGKYRGTAQPSGVYVYSLDFVGMENNKQKTFHLFGSLTLIR